MKHSLQNVSSAPWMKRRGAARFHRVKHSRAGPGAADIAFLAMSAPRIIDALAASVSAVADLDRGFLLNSHNIPRSPAAAGRGYPSAFLPGTPQASV